MSACVVISCVFWRERFQGLNFCKHLQEKMFLALTPGTSRMPL